MNIEQAVAITNMKKQQNVLLLQGQTTKTAKEIAVLVFDLSAAAGEPYKNATPKVWAERWLASKKFVLVDIDPRQVAVPFVNSISRSKVLATMQASASSLPPIVVDINLQGIGKTATGYVPSLIVVDGKHRHRAQMLCGRDRITAWVGEKALAQLQARAAVRKNFVIDKAQSSSRPLSNIEVQAALNAPSGGHIMAPTRQDTGDGGSRPSGGAHTPTRTGPQSPTTSMRSAGGQSSGAGPGSGVSGLNPARTGIYSDADPSDRNQSDPSDRGQMLDPSDKDQFSHGAPKQGDPRQQSPGSGVGPRTRPSTGASNSEMSRMMKAGPIKVKKIVTHKKKNIQAVAPPGFDEDTMHELKQKHGTESAFKIAWSSYNKGKD